MIIRPFEIDGIRERAARGTPLAPFFTVPAAGISLDAALELACAARDWRAGDGSALVERWKAQVPFLRNAVDAFKESPEVIHELASAELWRIETAQDWLDEAQGQQFLVRFERALRHCGFPVPFAQGLGKAFAEMTDNVLQHSGARTQEPAVAVAGFHVEHEWMTFAIADTGRGILASLRSNPRWAEVRNSTDALSAVLERRATRRPNEEEGHGFFEVFRALADRNALLRFRSGDGCLSLSGEFNVPTFERGSSPAMPGFQLSVVCALKTPAVLRSVESHAIA